MTNAATNVFDLLLGNLGAVNGQTGVSHEGTGTEADSILFGQILAGLMPSSEGLPVDQQIVQEDVARFEQLLANLPRAMVPNGIQASDDPIESIVGRSATLDSESLPFVTNVQNQSLKHLLDSSAVELPDGKYVVTEAVVNKGGVDLELVNDAAPESKIKLTIDAESLRQLKTDQTGGQIANHRVVLDGSDIEFDQLIQKTNLTEIDIKTTANDQAVKNTGQVEITLKGETVSANVVLSGVVPKKALRATVDQETSAKDEPAEKLAGIIKAKDDGSVITKVAKNSSPVDPKAVRAVTPSAVADPNPIWNNTRTSASPAKTTLVETGRLQVTPELRQFDLLSRFGTDTEQSANRNVELTFDQSLGMTSMEDGVRAGDHKVTFSNIRFSLPENIGTSLKPNGQSVTLQIEPEHLGPARLSLYVHDNKLSAHLVVNSMAAKEAIERTVDKLMSQLSNANIQVERIEVSVGGDSQAQEFADKRPDWMASSRARRAMSEFNDDLDTLGAGQPVSRMVDYYVNSSGVNLLA